MTYRYKTEIIMRRILLKFRSLTGSSLQMRSSSFTISVLTDIITNLHTFLVQWLVDGCPTSISSHRGKAKIFVCILNRIFMTRKTPGTFGV